jgi:copper chaperone CopZ
MKTKIIFITLIAALLTLSSFAANKKVVYNVSMHCESCQKRIEKNIAFEKGVKDMVVSLKDKTVAITFDDTKTNSEKLIAAFNKLGYEASEEALKDGAGTGEKSCDKANAPKDSCKKESGEKCEKAKADKDGKCKKATEGDKKSEANLNVSELKAGTTKGCCR